MNLKRLSYMLHYSLFLGFEADGTCAAEEKVDCDPSVLHKVPGK